MKIDLPRRLNRDSMYTLLQKVITRDRNPVSDELVLNFSTLSKFIEPCGVTILSNLIHWLENRGVTVDILPGEVSRWEDSPNKFLDDSMFFEQHLGEKLNEYSRVRVTTLPLQHVNAKDPMGWLSYKFTPWLSRQLDVPPNRLATIQVCME